jgi:hypothetical protein
LRPVTWRRRSSIDRGGWCSMPFVPELYEGLERDGRRTACEISVTTSEEQELSSTQKCLAAGYDTEILCSPKSRALNKVKALASQELVQSEQGKVLFLVPEELYFYLEKQVADEVDTQERVNGYKVKVRYRPVEGPEE